MKNYFTHAFRHSAGRWLLVVLSSKKKNSYIQHNSFHSEKFLRRTTKKNGNEILNEGYEGEVKPQKKNLHNNSLSRFYGQEIYSCVVVADLEER